MQFFNGLIIILSLLGHRWNQVRYRWGRLYTPVTNPSSTFFWPARSKSMVSLLPSMEAMLPLPNFWWKTRSPTLKGEGLSATDFATSSPSMVRPFTEPRPAP